MDKLFQKLRPVDFLPILFVVTVGCLSLLVEGPMRLDFDALGAWAIFTIVWVMIVALPAVVRLERDFWSPVYRNLPGHTLLIVLFVVVLFSSSWKTFIDPLTLMIAGTVLTLMYQLKKTKRHFSAVDFLFKFSPLIISFYIYENLRWFVSNINPIVMDPMLAEWDYKIFGIHLSVWMEQYQGPLLSEWFSFHYAAYVLYPITCALLFYYHDQAELFEDFSLGFCLCMYLGFLGYLAVPAVGPISGLIDVYQTATIPGMSLSNFREIVVEKYRYIRDAFPSLHTALSLFCVAMLWRRYRRLFWVAVFFEINLLISTVYLRMHYTVDLIAGALLAWLALILAPRINRAARVPRETMPTETMPTETPFDSKMV